MNNFRELNVWQKAVELATEIYNCTDKFPSSEKFSLTNQIRRSVVSISSNIAEGAGRNSRKEFSYFLDISTGSCYELETQLTISKNLGYLHESKFIMIENKIVEIQKMLYALKRSLKK